MALILVFFVNINDHIQFSKGKNHKNHKSSNSAKFDIRFDRTESLKTSKKSGSVRSSVFTFYSVWFGSRGKF